MARWTFYKAVGQMSCFVCSISNSVYDLHWDHCVVVWINTLFFYVHHIFSNKLIIEKKCTNQLPLTEAGAFVASRAVSCFTIQTYSIVINVIIIRKNE